MVLGHAIEDRVNVFMEENRGSKIESVNQTAFGLNMPGMQTRLTIVVSYPVNKDA